MDKTLLGWLLLLGIGFPFIGLLLNEAVERLEKPQPLLADALRKTQQYVLPPLAALLVMRKLLNSANAENLGRLVETATWIAIIVAGVALLNALLTTQKRQARFQIQVPNLFFQVLRATVVLAISYYILGRVWSVDLAQFVTAVGVGSLAIALALQNTLNNLVSGLLLLIAKPFKVRDVIDAGGSKGSVAEQNWWSVTLENPWGFKIIVPNGTLAGATIINHGTDGSWEKVEISFSYDDPPNKVIPALEAAVVGVKGLQSDGIAGVSKYADSGIEYQLWFKVKSADAWVVFNELMGRLYYVAERNGFTIPYPIGVEYSINSDAQPGLAIPQHLPELFKDRKPEISDYLRSSPYFTNLDDDGVESFSATARFSRYGKGEVIVQEGKVDEGFYLVVSGRARIWTQNHQGYPQTMGLLSRGEVFGEMSLFPGELSPITVIAEEDVEVILIGIDEMVAMIQRKSMFGFEMTRFIEEKRSSLNVVKGLPESEEQPISSNGRASQTVRPIS
ncbi:MAG: cyclic nucleotide-binding domain-containing protein [Cyanobacteria bacterium P01_F01_bin.53]